MDRAKDIFDINNISKADMSKLANQIEEYLSLLEDIMIIPDEIYEDHAEEIFDSIKIAKKLIKKLRKGDKDVFKEETEWEYNS